MNPLQDVFISYGRADSLGFATKLNQRLTEAGLEVWFDFDDIPLGVDYQQQIDDGIEKADNFVFVISPHSVNSPYCRLEIELAIQRHKRIIPLLHVEQIGRETWQQRNPHGTEAEWQAYQAAGKHSSFANMHPLISKINWVYFRENADDVEASLQNLLGLFQRDQRYVREHTVLLNRALTWEANHRQPRDLLVEAPLRKAEAWLQTRFRDRQPPCTPTPLHCQFITESLKNAQDGMTEAFLSHASEDRATLDKIYASLARAGLTVWTNWRDIQTGVDFKEAINSGIEGTDSVVYLISPEALQSSWCQYEIDYALSLHKRIIPVLIEPIDLQTLPDHLQRLQFIDLTDNVRLEDYLSDESDLLKALAQEADYYKKHKLLLVEALRWERQLRNPCVLQRGYTLRQTEAWLKVAQKRSRNRPLPIQEDFVQASLNQPPDIELNVFIASDARDLEFARKLNETLQIQGEHTWFEPDKTVLGPDAETQIKEAIEQAENFIFVVSTDALADASLLTDLHHAKSLGKRIVAVTSQSLNSAELPELLLDRPLVDFSVGGDDFMSDFGVLYRILKSHPDHVRDHTRLLIRALEWQQSGQDDSALMWGKELTKAEQWLTQAQEQSPQPSDLQKIYIKASRALALRKVKPRSVLGISIGVTFLVWVARLFGWFQGIELFAYDHLLQQRRNEPPDDRFLIITVDEKSGSFIRDGLIQGRYQPSIGTVPDEVLNEALQVLTENQARLIGLDFYRDFPAEDTVALTLRNTDRLITLCKASYDGVGVAKAPEVPIERVGFSDFLTDHAEGTAYFRRHYLMQTADAEFCPTETAFSLLLAHQYLQQEGITFTSPASPAGGFRGNGLQFDDQVIPNLSPIGSGPYAAGAGILNGYQILLNFRTAPNPDRGIAQDPQQFAPTFSLEALLTNQVPRNLIEDRLVLIGYVDFADRNADQWETPFGGLPGVFAQGQMASQLISHILDGRSLIRWWGLGPEALWILSWALAGGFMARYTLRLSQTVAVSAGGVLVLYGSCYGAMVLGALWLPLVPPLVTFLLTARGVAMLNYSLRRP